MMGFLSYFDLLLISLVAAAALLGIFLARRRWNTRPTRLRLLLATENPPHASSQRLVSLLVFEEDFPSFCEILGLVLEKFPLERFEVNPEFRAALEFMDRAAYRTTDPLPRKSAMCVIVRSFLDDPDVEYHCRPLLSTLVDQFLVEIGETAQPRRAEGSV